MLSLDDQPEEQTDDSKQEDDMPAEEILCFSDGLYSVAPVQRNSPVSFFRQPKLVAMAFPVQFSTGGNTPAEKRHIKMTLISYFKARLILH